MKKFISLIIMLSLSLSLVGCGGPESTDMIEVSNNYIVLENSNIRVLINRTSGFVSTIKNKNTDFVNKNSTEGAWPFYLEYNENGRTADVSIDSDTLNVVSKLETYTENGADYLVVTYDNLVTDGKKSKETGIKATVTYSISAEDEYFKYKVTLDTTNSLGEVDMLHLAQGGDQRSGCGPDEYLTAPMWGTGTKWENPIANKAFLVGKSLGYPGVGAQSLQNGWLSLNGEEQGVGIAYINNPSLAAEFKVQSSGQGMGLGVVLFAPKQMIGRSVPLESGKVFTTGEVIVASHTGSWHKLADIYRKEYSLSFVKEDGTPDYLTADTISPIADNLWYMLRTIGNSSGQSTDGGTFKAQTDNLLNSIDQLGLEPEHTWAHLVGNNAGTYGADVPYQLPLNESLADDGETALESYIKHFNRFKDRGAYLLLYTHPFAMDYERQEVIDILPLVNPGQHEENWNAGKHYSVCIDNSTIKNLWRDTLIPQYKSLLADGVQFDQGSLQQTVCDMSGHDHGTDSVSRLSSHIKAINELAIMVKEGLGEGSYIFSEAHNDLTCRYIDIGSTSWLVHTPLWEGEFEYGASMYTMPQYIWLGMNYITDSYGNINEFYRESAVMGGMALLTDGSIDDTKREYVRFTRDVRTNVSYYPHGYRDTLGIGWTDPTLFARVYVGEDEVTVCYTSPSTVEDCQITVDLNKLGFSGKGTKTVTVNLDANKIAYVKIAVE